MEYSSRKPILLQIIALTLLFSCNETYLSNRLESRYEQKIDTFNFNWGYRAIDDTNASALQNNTRFNKLDADELITYKIELEYYTKEGNADSVWVRLDDELMFGYLPQQKYWMPVEYTYRGLTRSENITLFSKPYFSLFKYNHYTLIAFSHVIHIGDETSYIDTHANGDSFSHLSGGILTNSSFRSEWRIQADSVELSKFTSDDLSKEESIEQDVYFDMKTDFFEEEILKKLFNTDKTLLKRVRILKIESK